MAGKHGRAVYKDPRWRKLRLIVLKYAPQCATSGCYRQAREVDHIVRLADGGAPFDPANLQGLCKRCHRRKSRADHLQPALADTARRLQKFFGGEDVV